MTQSGTTAERIYVDFGAIRIQAYLNRTPDLRGHRGASDALAKATRATEVQDAIGELGEVNPEAGEADGVVSVRFPAVSEEADEQQVRTIQDRLLTHLQRALPAAEFHSGWARGASYLDAYPALKAQFAHGDVRYGLPVTAEFPLASVCPSCRTDPAAVEERNAEGPVTLCRDCSVRNVAKEHTARTPESPEGRLMKGLRDMIAPAPPTFDALSQLGSTQADTHLATVAADGNSVGQFFEQLLVHGQEQKLHDVKEHISPALSGATREALEQATLELPLTERLEQLVVVPHVLGGDDVLVTLPAQDAWTFTLEFLQQFQQQLRQNVESILVKAGVTAESQHKLLDHLPTASAGIVFGHRTLPITLAMEAAGQRLDEAKGQVLGREASVQWHDFTSDGPNKPTHLPLTLKDLRENGKPTELAAHLDALAKVPMSHRIRLRDALEESEIAAGVLAHRVGHWEIVQQFLHPFTTLPNEGDTTTTPHQESAATSVHPPPSGLGLDAALSLVRWW